MHRRSPLHQTADQMRAASAALAQWEIEAGRRIFGSRRRLFILAAVCLPAFLFVATSSAWPEALTPHLPALGGSKALMPANVDTGMFLGSILVGLIAGLITGVIGAGGGYILTPALMSFGVRGIMAVGTDQFHLFAKAIMGTVDPQEARQRQRAARRVVRGRLVRRRHRGRQRQPRDLLRTARRSPTPSSRWCTSSCSGSWASTRSNDWLRARRTRDQASSTQATTGFALRAAAACRCARASGSTRTSSPAAAPSRSTPSSSAGSSSASSPRSWASAAVSSPSRCSSTGWASPPSPRSARTSCRSSSPRPTRPSSSTPSTGSCSTASPSACCWARSSACRSGRWSPPGSRVRRSAPSSRSPSSPDSSTVSSPCPRSSTTSGYVSLPRTASDVIETVGTVVFFSHRRRVRRLDPVGVRARRRRRSRRGHRRGDPPASRRAAPVRPGPRAPRRVRRPPRLHAGAAVGRQEPARGRRRPLQRPRQELGEQLRQGGVPGGEVGGDRRRPGGQPRRGRGCADRCSASSRATPRARSRPTAACA